MSITKEALEYLRDQALIKANIAGDFAGVILPKDTAVHTLEQLQMYRNRFSGCFVTTLIPDFANYVNENGEAVCFIEPTLPNAAAVFDLGTPDQPGHGVHTAHVQLDKTPSFTALQLFESGAHTQQACAAFLEDWREHVTATDTTGEEMDFKKAIAAIRRVTLDASKKADHSVGQLSANKTSIEQLDAHSNGSPLPGWITFSCSPFDGLSIYDFHLRVSLILRSDNIVFSLKASNFAQQRRAYQLEFMALIKASLDHSKNAVYIGTFKLK